MARTTLNLDSAVLRDLKSRGAREGKPLGQVASELLAQSLAESGEDVHSAPLQWVSRDLGRPQIDLDDRDAVALILDRESLGHD